jgi:hypothetical protein
MVLLASLSQQANACKCIGPGEYDVVFEGKVLKIETEPKKINTEHYYKVHFKVEKTIKGKIEAEATIYTGSSLLCGAHYILGEKYTVYALYKDHLQTRYCYGRELK